MPQDLAVLGAALSAADPPKRSMVARSGDCGQRAFGRVFADVAFAFDGAYRAPASLSIAQRAAYGMRDPAAAIAPSQSAATKAPEVLLQLAKSATSLRRPSSQPLGRSPAVNTSAAARQRRLGAAPSNDRRGPLSQMRATRWAPPMPKPRLFSLTVRHDGTAIRCIVWRGRTTIAVFTPPRKPGAAS